MKNRFAKCRASIKRICCQWWWLIRRTQR